MIPGKNMPDGFQRLAFIIIVIDQYTLMFMSSFIIILSFKIPYL